MNAENKRGIIIRKKRSLEIIITDAAVGGSTLTGGLYLSGRIYDLMEHIRPDLSIATGELGETFIRYGATSLPALFGVWLSLLAVKATDYYLSHEKVYR